MKNKQTFILVGILTFIMSSLSAQMGATVDLETMSAKGKELYFERVSCWVCHSDDASGGVGPTLLNGPTPLDIQEQLDSNPQMAVIVSELNPSIDDLLALSVYIRELGGNATSVDDVNGWRTELSAMLDAKAEATVFALSVRDKKVLEIQSFDTVTADWQRKAKMGSLKQEYQVTELDTYENGEAVFTPEPGKTYFYQNIGTTARRVPMDLERSNYTQVVVGDADTKEVIVSGAMPEELRGSVHTTVLSPDARYVYIIGPSGAIPMDSLGPVRLRTPATLLKVDALTLKPIKQLDVGGRMHHGQVFQDKYLLIDTFIAIPGGLDVFLFDPETDQIIGGVRSEDLGGSTYTAYTDNEFIYILMQPGSEGGELGVAMGIATGEFTASLPYWVAKLDPETWEVVAEYPFRGVRGDWVIIDSNSDYLYVPAAGSANVTKINNSTGAIEWSTPTGVGPYGGTLNVDETELWVSNKGEAAGALGRTLTVVDTESGRGLDTVFSGYQADHVLLSPSGREMWVTSNGEGRIYVFDAATKEQLKVIDMPDRGSPHGLVWVEYDDKGVGRVVRDQGGFHNGINPADGRPLLN
jgi:DNA-binding beta-propeller fold protein YncE